MINNSLFNKIFLCFKCFRKQINIIKILDENSTRNCTVDLKNIKIIMCDKNFKITFSTLVDYKIGTILDQVEPYNMNILFKEWHKECQENNKELIKNISINSKNYFLIVLPIIINDELVGSSMKLFDFIQK